MDSIKDSIKNNTKDNWKDIISTTLEQKNNSIKSNQSQEKSEIQYNHYTYKNKIN